MTTLPFSTTYRISRARSDGRLMWPKWADGSVGMVAQRHNCQSSTFKRCCWNIIWTLALAPAQGMEAWSATRMIVRQLLTISRGQPKRKTQQAQLALLKVTNGGFRLAYQLMSSDLYTYSKVLYIVLRPLWSWYVDQVESVKTQKHGLAELLALAEGRWMSDPQLAALITNALHCSASLSYMEVPPGNSKLSERILSVTRSLLGQRAWSMAARHHAPPQTYVGLLSRCPLRQRRAIRRIDRDWATLLLLEQRRLSHEPACRLWKDISFAQIRPLRLLWALCEGFKGDIECAPVKRLLRGLLDTFPDNKIVEDVHNGVKLDAQKHERQDAVHRGRPIL